jgi:hypothetical protein
LFTAGFNVFLFFFLPLSLGGHFLGKRKESNRVCFRKQSSDQLYFKMFIFSRKGFEEKFDLQPTKAAVNRLLVATKQLAVVNRYPALGLSKNRMGTFLFGGGLGERAWGRGGVENHAERKRKGNGTGFSCTCKMAIYLFDFRSINIYFLFCRTNSVRDLIFV